MAQPRILVAISSYRESLANRMACRNTWLKDLPEGIFHKFFVGQFTNDPTPVDEEDVVTVDEKDGYYKQVYKTFAFFKWALANADFDYIFRCDDDNYVRAEHLPKLIHDKADIIGDAKIASHGSANSGAGWFIRRDALEKIVEEFDKITDPVWEDFTLGEINRSIRLKMMGDYRLSASHAPFPNELNELITCHWVSPEFMMDIHAIVHGQFVARVPVKHKDNGPITIIPANEEEEKQANVIYFLKYGRFVLATTCATGYYRFDIAGNMLLQFDGSTEYMVLKLQSDGIYGNEALQFLAPVYNIEHNLLRNDKIVSLSDKELKLIRLKHENDEGELVLIIGKQGYRINFSDDTFDVIYSRSGELHIVWANDKIETYAMDLNGDYIFLK